MVKAEQRAIHTVELRGLQTAEVVRTSLVDGADDVRTEHLLQQVTGPLLPAEPRVAAPLRRRTYERIHRRGHSQVRCPSTGILWDVVQLKQRHHIMTHMLDLIAMVIL